jgi:catechol 2,3-dioxygenase-like lactoylglutathione lyase family enzyme
MVAMEQDPATHAVSDGFRLGKLFHLTPLVDSIADAEFFFSSVFAPVCIMRNYSPHWHRHGAIYVIAETSIEPMQPLPPPTGQEGTSWFRYMDKYGPHVHNIAFYVENAPALTDRLTEAGVRTTDGGTPNTVFAHPKDTPGMLEFNESTDEFRTDRRDPRFSEHWAALRDDFWPRRHPLGLERLSHITVVVHDVVAARRFYIDVLDAIPLPDQTSSIPDADASFVMVGEDTVVELVHPRDASSLTARELDTVGQCVIGVTFKVRDIARAAEHLTQQSAPVLNVAEHEILLDRERTWNTDYRFTDLDLIGDPRTDV